MKDERKVHIVMNYQLVVDTENWEILTFLIFVVFMDNK